MNAGPWQGLDVMVSAECEPIMVGVMGASRLKLNAVCILHVQRKPHIFPITESLNHTMNKRFIAY